MMGVRRSIGLPLYLEKINSQCLGVKWQLIQLIGIIILLGDLMSFFVPFTLNQPIPLTEIFKFLIFFLVHWLFILPLLIFAIPQIITKKESSMTAIIQAYQHAAHGWKKILLSYGLLYLPYCLIGIVCNLFYMPAAQLASFILLRIILSIWLLPMTMILGGIIFRDTYKLAMVPR